MEPEGQDNTSEVTQGQENTEQASGENPIEAQSTGTGINPAWNELLEVMPSSLHSQITPHLSKWDQNFQTKVNEVHSQYEPYKPFLENQVNPEQINYALGILQAIEERPEEVLNALRAYMGEEEKVTEQQGPPTQDNGPSEQPEWKQDPEWIKTQEMLNTVAQLMVQQRQTETQQQEDSALERDLTAAKTKYGEYDEEWVLTKMYNNPELDIDAAVKAYKDFESSVASRSNPRLPGPPVLGPGGSVPNQDYKPSSLDSKGKKSLVAQMLQQAAQQNQ